MADRSGNAIKIPYVFNQLNRKLARWAFRACTSADLKLPSFALADDGVLIEHRGKDSLGVRLDTRRQLDHIVDG